MVISILTACLALRAGLGLRRRRRRRLRRSAAEIRAHARLGKLAVTLIVIGLVAGPVSASWLRGWNVLETVHAWVALLAAALFGATAVLGRCLERGRGRPVEQHALLALLAILAAAAAFGTGFVLLP